MSSIEDMGNMASLDLISEYTGCNCCLVANDTMIEDGLRYMICEQENVICVSLFRYINSEGFEVLCYKGTLINLSFGEKEQQESNLKVN